jgi:hypothetical protein
MNSQQIKEFLLAMQTKAEADMKANKEEGKADQEKAEADRKIDKEERKADRVQMQERMEAHQREIKEMMKIMNSNHKETLACRETTEERLEEKKPTSPDRKPEAAQKTEVPAENATVMPAGEPKKKWRRDRKLATERCHQEPKETKKTPGKIGPCPQWVEPPWESNTAHEGNRPEDVPTCDSGTTQKKHLQEVYDAGKFEVA